MATENEITLDSAFRTLSVSGEIHEMSGPRPKTYKPAQLTNFLTGKREEIFLVDPQNEVFERALLADVNHNAELHADLNAALSAFSIIEKRIIFRVLVQGQSVKEATKKMKKSARHWELWLRNHALPIMQTLLEDYRKDLENVGIYMPKDLSKAESDSVEFPPAESRFGCHNCGYVADTFSELRDHNEDHHTSYFINVQRELKDMDDELAREARKLKEHT